MSCRGIFLHPLLQRLIDSLHVNISHTLNVGAMQYITCNLDKACFRRIFQSRRDTPDLSLFVFSLARAPGKTSKDISPPSIQVCQEMSLSRGEWNM